jgi:uncharacterized protein YbjT (DUF2867 family)
MQNMSRMTIGILGGSGFVGSALANRLVAGGHRVRLFTRAREHARDCWLLPNTEVVELDPREQEHYNHGFAGLDAVVNLVGILNERGDDGTGFRQAHVDIPLRAAKACKTADVAHLLHMSALNADSFASSYYLRSKGEAEKLLQAESGKRLVVTILRPSVIFGPHDDFTNRFARLLHLAPGVFPLARASARLQPVFVDDVAEAMVRCLTQREAAGRRYDLGGPEIMTLGEIVSYIGRVVGRPVRVIGLNDFLSAVQANVLEYVPGKPFSRDNLRSLSEDSVCTQANGLDQLAITPTPMRVVVPRYLGGDDVRHRFYAHRTAAGRD